MWCIYLNGDDKLTKDDSLWRVIRVNCWKTINMSKQYGFQRMAFLSIITMLFTFIFLYVPITYFFIPASAFYDKHFHFFIFGIILLYPLHKMMHYLPIAHLGAKVRKRIEWKYGIYPIIHIRVSEPISKPLFLLSLFFPFIIISFFFVCLCLLLPNYIHYFTILSAFHVGICVPDFIYGKNIVRAPKQCFIEENDEGFEILINKNFSKRAST